METAGPIAYISSMVINSFMFENFISKSVNRMPSPVRRSAIPCKDARLNSLANTGTSLILKLSMVKRDFDKPSFFIE